MLIIYDANRIYAALKGEALEALEAHIRDGFPDLLSGFEAGTVRGMIISDTADPSNLILDSGAPRERTADEIAALAADAPDPALEAKIKDTLRQMAIDKLTQTGDVVVSGDKVTLASKASSEAVSRGSTAG